MRVAEKPKPWLSLLTAPDPNSKKGGLTIVIALRPYRSKYTTLECQCKRRRKDGTCRTLDQIIEILRHPERTRLKHYRIDERVDRVPLKQPSVAAKQPSGEG